MGHLAEVSEANFQSEVLAHSGKVLVDFWAPWCGPCRMLAPTLQGISTDRSDVKIVKVNVDDNPGIAAQYRVQNIPFMGLFKDGQMIGNLVGNVPRSKIEAFIDSTN